MKYKSRTNLIKIITSIIAGLLAFFLSPYNKSYEIGSVAINIPWSLIFPILITMAYGYNFGLLSAICGGALYPFVLWEENGWANILNTFNLFILIGMVGYVFNHVKKIGIIVLSAILYIIFLTLLYLVVFKQVLEFNPSFWTTNTVNYYSKEILLSIYFKNIINYVIIILFSEALLKLPAIRKVFGLRIENYMRKNNKVFLLSLFSSVGIWCLFYIFDYLINTQSITELSNQNYLSLAFIIIVGSASIIGRVLINYMESNLKVSDLLREREKTYKAQYNYFPIPVLTIKRKDGNLIFSDFNEATKNYPYIDSDKIKNKSLEDFFDLKGEKGFIEIINNIFKTKKTQTLDLEYLFKTTGTKRNLSVVCGFVPPDSVHLTLIDTTARKNAQRKMIYAMMNAEERERTRIAKELHDGVSPVLAAIKLYIQSFVTTKNIEVREDLSEKIYDTINESIRTVSEISNKLSPHILDNFGLEVAIQNFIEKITDTTNIAFNYSYNMNSKINEKVEVNIYRVITELINNTVKYANANKVIIKFYEEEEQIMVHFEHNGKGFNLDSVLESNRGMGLNNLFNRVQVLNGNIDYKTSEDSNTEVNINIPLA